MTEHPQATQVPAGAPAASTPKPIGSQAITGFAMAVIGGIVAVLGLLLGLGLNKWFDDAVNARVDPLPRDAVIAFLKACPSGWVDAVTDASASSGPYLRLGTASIPATGGAGSITLTEAHIPKLGLRSANPDFLSGISMHIGPAPKQIYRYSFTDTDGGVGGLLSVPMDEIFIGSEKPQPIALEPQYQAIYLCKRSPS